MIRNAVRSILYVSLTVLWILSSCRKIPENHEVFTNFILGAAVTDSLAATVYCSRSRTNVASVDSVIDSVKNTYGIQICLKSNLPPVVTADFLTPADYAELQIAVDQFQLELQRLPVSYVRSWNLKTALFAKNITMLGGGVSGLSVAGSSLIIYELYVTPAFRQFLIHHEIFHLVDYLYSGSRLYYDDVWNSYNIRSDLYDGSYLYCSSGGGLISHPVTGILNNYSLCSMTEDKAEIYSLQFNPVTYASIMSFISGGDTVLDAKVKHVRRMAYGLSPAMDQNFWNTL